MSMIIESLTGAPNFESEEVKNQFERYQRYILYLDVTKPIEDYCKHGIPIPDGPLLFERYVEPDVLEFILGVPETEFEYCVGSEIYSGLKANHETGVAKYDLVKLNTYFYRHDLNRCFTPDAIPPESMDKLTFI